jgi:hypothetical protein
MTAEIPHTPERKTEAVADNARKFRVGPIDESFLEKHKASSTKLIVDWLEIDKGTETEIKLAYKKDLRTREIEILLISKTGVGSDRKTTRDDITQEEYDRRKSELSKKPSVPHLEKTRYAFTYSQNGTAHFPVKYDVFERSELRMLEVEDSSEGEEEFSPDDFPFDLSEVSDNQDYSGYRVAGIV